MESQPLEWEQLLVSLRHGLPQPVREDVALDGSTMMIGGDPPEVIVRVTGSSLTVSEFAVEWPGPHDVVPSPVELGTLIWPLLPGVQAMRIVAALIAAARDLRRSTYTECRLCERSLPPEAMRDGEVCLRCAQSQPEPSR